MEGLALCKQLTDISYDIFRIFSKRDNIIMFCTAKDGLKTNSAELRDEIPTKKRYYKALKQLKNLRLIEKNKFKDTYFHTNFGSIIYQKLFVEVTEIAKEKEKILCSLQHVDKSSSNDISQIVNDIIHTYTDNKDNGVILPFNSEIIWSNDKLILSLIEKVKGSNKEILIATRLYSEQVVNELILKSKVGVNVKILADTKLVQGYFKSQNDYIESFNDNENNTNDFDNKNERLKVISNPWYPNKEGVQRKVIDISFGLLVIDEKEIGIEIINRNDTQNFFAAIFLRDEKLALDVKEYYMKLWDGASYDVPIPSPPIN